MIYLSVGENNMSGTQVVNMFGVCPMPVFEVRQQSQAAAAAAAAPPPPPPFFFFFCLGKIYRPSNLIAMATVQTLIFMVQ